VAAVTDPDLKQSILDEEHLRLLSLGYLISAIITGLFSLLGLFYMFIGVMMGSVFASAAHTSTHADGLPPQMMGWFFAVFGGLFFVLGAALAIAKYFTGKYLKQHRKRTFCQVVAGISCLSIPYGTALGLATFLTLAKPSVSGLFDQSTAV
jgi:hypothetical protein